VDLALHCSSLWGFNPRFSGITYPCSKRGTVLFMEVKNAGCGLTCRATEKNERIGRI
jgi:hypothetical protein